MSDYMIYTRGAEDDWNRYADLTGDEGWNWENILSYAKKVRVICTESLFAGADIDVFDSSRTSPTTLMS